jgi:predicted DNA-binding transcriptional regulator AlpA
VSSNLKANWPLAGQIQKITIAKTPHYCRSAQLAHEMEVQLPEQDEWILLKEISEELKIPERTLRYYQKLGDFPDVYRFGKRHMRFKRSDFESWKAQHLEK